MTTDTRAIVHHLSTFYDFTDRVVLHVGAGGGQIVESARAARAVIAVDPDRRALVRLSLRLREERLADRFTLVAEDVLTVTSAANVVLFEFSLHQISDPDGALSHARRLAPDILVIDHAPESPWSWAAAEDGRVRLAWNAVERRAIRRERSVDGWQHFRDHDEIAARLAGCGPVSASRIQRYRGQTMVSIPMPYRMALL